MQESSGTVFTQILLVNYPSLRERINHHLILGFSFWKRLFNLRIELIIKNEQAVIAQRRFSKINYTAIYLFYTDDVKESIARKFQILQLYLRENGWDNNDLKSYFFIEAI